LKIDADYLSGYAMESSKLTSLISMFLEGNALSRSRKEVRGIMISGEARRLDLSLARREH